jgi:hypothetical protein
MNKYLLFIFIGLLIILGGMYYTRPDMLVGLFNKEADEVALTATSTGGMSSASTATLPPEVPVVSEGTRTVTMADAGKVVRVKEGVKVVIALGPETWTYKMDNGKILSVVKNAPLVAGSQGMFTAVAVGTSTILAEGTTTCAGKEACTPSRVSFIGLLSVEK